MLHRNKLITYLNQLLTPEKFSDYCPNGLQVEGREEILNIVSGVTASQELIEKAIEKNADVLLVHHGYFWRGEDQVITNIKQKRISSLLKNNINLIAYHLPLDTHPIYGNNVQLAKQLDWKISGNITTNHLICYYDFAKEISGDEIQNHLEKKLHRKPLHISSNKKINRIAWCTGAAQDYLQNAALNNCDAYISGEISERTFHEAKEFELHYFAAGHHATEKYGVKALGEHLAEKFSLQHYFIDAENPV